MGPYLKILNCISDCSSKVLMMLVFEICSLDWKDIFATWKTFLSNFFYENMYKPISKGFFERNHVTLVLSEILKFLMPK